MGAIIARQPNGLYCRFSSVVDTITDYNMTEEEYIEMCAERARKEARDVLKNYLRPFENVLDDFRPRNENVEVFRARLKEMGFNGEFNYEFETEEDE